jgi:hypothetical protein
MGCGNPVKRIFKEAKRIGGQINRETARTVDSIGSEDLNALAGKTFFNIGVGGIHPDSAGARNILAGKKEPVALDPLTPFALPTNFELTSARKELQSVLRKKRARSRTDFTGGLPQASVTAPMLRTA